MAQITGWLMFTIGLGLASVGVRANWGEIRRAMAAEWYRWRARRGYRV
jgi:hypothetical protein